MADSDSGYKVGPGRPPLHTRFQKGQSGNPGGRSTKSLSALLADALNETVVMTIDGRRRTITKREAIVTQMVDKSASADLRATKMLIDMMRDVKEKIGDGCAAARSPLAGRGGQGGGAALRGAGAPADPARDRRSEGGGPARIALHASRRIARKFQYHRSSEKHFAASPQRSGAKSGRPKWLRTATATAAAGRQAPRRCRSRPPR